MGITQDLVYELPNFLKGKDLVYFTAINKLAFKSRDKVYEKNVFTYFYGRYPNEFYKKIRRLKFLNVKGKKMNDNIKEITLNECNITLNVIYDLKVLFKNVEKIIFNNCNLDLDWMDVELNYKKIVINGNKHQDRFRFIHRFYISPLTESLIINWTFQHINPMNTELNLKRLIIKSRITSKLYNRAYDITYIDPIILHNLEYLKIPRNHNIDLTRLNPTAKIEYFE